MPVEHQGNQNSSPEEGEAIEKMVAEILAAKTTWVDMKGEEKTGRSGGYFDYCALQCAGIRS
jgi:hypothetical protein